MKLAETVRQRAAGAAFGSPVVQNHLRAIVVEAMVDIALGRAWRWCVRDSAPWDFEHDDGTHLEVRQSAARQTWATQRAPAAPRFDIAPRADRWHGAIRTSARQRFGHIYVFAYHPIADDRADHGDPSQWQFYVVPTLELPDARSVSLRRLQALVEVCPFDGLAARIEALRVA